MNVTLRPGETATPAGLAVTVTLADVRDDSRCPVDTSCLWAGDATVVVDVAPDGRPARTVLLHLAGDDTRHADIDRVRVRLESLSPERRAGTTPARGEYRVTLSLSRP